MSTRIVPKTHLRDRIRDEIDALGSDTLVVTERGRPVAVMVSVNRWNDLQEALEEAEDALALVEHRISGDTGVPAESVFAAIATAQVEQAHVPGPARQAG